MKPRLIYRLDDSVIAQIVRLIQIGALTMTDVSDHMRSIRMQPSTSGDGSLVLTPEYIEKDQRDIDSMFDHLEKMMEANGVKV